MLSSTDESAFSKFEIAAAAVSFTRESSLSFYSVLPATLYTKIAGSLHWNGAATKNPTTTTKLMTTSEKVFAGAPGDVE